MITLEQGKAYSIEWAGSQRITRAVCVKRVDDAPLGVGFSFDLRGARRFVYAKDITRAPDGTLIVIDGR